jgi:hypothetical protein
MPSNEPSQMKYMSDGICNLTIVILNFFLNIFVRNSFQRWDSNLRKMVFLSSFAVNKEPVIVLSCHEEKRYRL